MRVLLLVFLFLATLSFASDFDIDIQKIVKKNKKVASVVIDQKTIIKLHDYIDKKDPYVRAQLISDRLKQFVAMGYDPQKIELKNIKNRYTGLIGIRVIFEVGQIDALEKGVTTEELAKQWQKSIQHALRNVEVSYLGVPLDDEKFKATTIWPIVGYASWFKHDTDEFVAVHPYLKSGTKIRVRNQMNGWTVVVTIIDNKPLPNKRVINLSLSAAKALGIAEKGVGKVKLSKVY
jgi:hypothetical protein